MIPIDKGIYLVSSETSSKHLYSLFDVAIKFEFDSEFKSDNPMERLAWTEKEVKDPSILFAVNFDSLGITGSDAIARVEEFFRAHNRVCMVVNIPMKNQAEYDSWETLTKKLAGLPAKPCVSTTFRPEKIKNVFLILDQLTKQTVSSMIGSIFLEKTLDFVENVLDVRPSGWNSSFFADIAIVCRSKFCILPFAQSSEVSCYMNRILQLYDEKETFYASKA
jgi:hypothetical protein